MNADAEPRFLDLEVVLFLHRRSLELHGGLDGVRDPGAVESALASAKNTYFYGGGDNHDIAAAYAFHIAESQAFLDGNKRTCG
jgi:death-on-curing protein